MQVIRDLSEAAQIRHPQIRELVLQRIHELGGERFDSAAIGYFLVVEVGDTLQALQSQLGFNIVANRHTGVRYDQPGFTPSWEFVEDLAECWDAVWILGNSYGVEIFIPKDTGIDPDLQAMCAMYAVGAPSAISGGN